MTKLTGADRPTLFRMRKAGTLPSFLALDGIRLKVLVNKDAVVPMVAQRTPRLRLIHAAEMLGVPTYAIREIAHLGLVEVVPVPPGRGDYLQLAVCRDGMQALYDKLYCRLAQPRDAHPVSLAQAMRKIGGRPKPWAQVFKAIVDGELTASLAEGEAPLAQRITIGSTGAHSLPRFQPTKSMDWSSCMVTKTDLAEIMNIRPPHFSRHSEFLLGPGPAFREITMDAALQLARTYISTGEMSRKLHVYRRAVGNLAQSYGVKPAAPGLFRRAQAEQFIPGLLGS